MTLLPYPGLRGTSSLATDQDPKSWRGAMSLLEPNGDVSLTGLTDKLRTKTITSTEHNWWTKHLSSQTGTITGVYTNTALNAAYTTGGVAGDVIYLKMSADHAKEFRGGHTVLIRDASDLLVDVHGRVTASTINGSSSYLTVTLLEADDNSGDHDLSDADTVFIIGTAHPEGDTFPTAVSYNPVKMNNLTQIFRTPYTITGTLEATELRTGDPLVEERREKLVLHGIELEKALWFGKRYEGTGSNGQPLRTMDGIFSFIDQYAPTNRYNFATDEAYAGQTWAEAGEDFLDTKFEALFRYGSSTKWAFAGSGAILGLTRLAKAGGYYQIGPETSVYGIRVKEYQSPNGRMMMVQHPLFTQIDTLRNRVALIEPENLTYVALKGRDTKHLKQNMSDSYNGTGIDGRREEWITECTLEVLKPETFAYIDGVGEDNELEEA